MQKEAPQGLRQGSLCYSGRFGSGLAWRQTDSQRKTESKTPKGLSGGGVFTEERVRQKDPAAWRD